MTCVTSYLSKQLCADQRDAVLLDGFSSTGGLRPE